MVTYQTPLQNSVQKAKEAACFVAAEILDYAQQVKEGRFHFFADDQGFDRINFTKIIRLIEMASAQTLSRPDTVREITDQHRMLAADILGDGFPPLDEIYRAGLTVVAESAKQYWDIMSKTENQVQDSSYYTGFHVCLEFLEIDPQSDDVLAFLDVARDDFKRVDHAHALSYIYETASMLHHPLFNDIKRRSMEERRQQSSDGEMDLTAVFQQTQKSEEAGFCEDIEYALRRSCLDNQQVVDYFVQRISQDLSNDDNEPHPFPYRQLQ